MKGILFFASCQSLIECLIFGEKGIEPLTPFYEKEMNVSKVCFKNKLTAKMLFVYCKPLPNDTMYNKYILYYKLIQTFRHKLRNLHSYFPHNLHKSSQSTGNLSTLEYCVGYLGGSSNVIGNFQVILPPYPIKRSRSEVLLKIQQGTRSISVPYSRSTSVVQAYQSITESYSLGYTSRG